jgi:hypothetical protein
VFWAAAAGASITKTKAISPRIPSPCFAPKISLAAQRFLQTYEYLI